MGTVTYQILVHDGWYSINTYSQERKKERKVVIIVRLLVYLQRQILRNFF